MNILVGDSGATKTDWVLLGGKEPQFIQTEGLNPHLVTAEEFFQIIVKELRPNLLGKSINRIYFFGAGCGAPEKKKEVEKYLSKVFEQSAIHIQTDLDGAGLALFGQREGIVCILGSGSSAGFYKEGRLIKQMPSIGYPFGDEGSGSHIGQKLLISYLEGSMDKKLKAYFEDQESIDYPDLFYQLQQPRKAKLYVGHVCKLFAKKSSHREVQGIIFDGFSEFLDNVIEFFPEESKSHELGFVGSIASVYEGELRACAKQKGVEIYSVIRSPIEHIALQFSR
jgi:N-acetylglucosamine kinase-like BadF-type ATPase